MQVTTEAKMSGKRLVEANEYHLGGHEDTRERTEDTQCTITTSHVL